MDRWSMRASLPPLPDLYFCLHRDCLKPDGSYDESAGFKHGDFFWKHVEEVHTKDEDCIYQCLQCPKRFAMFGLLRRHEKKHLKNVT